MAEEKQKICLFKGILFTKKTSNEYTNRKLIKWRGEVKTYNNITVNKFLWNMTLIVLRFCLVIIFINILALAQF